MAKHRDWENPPIVGRNKFPGHMPLGAYPGAVAGLLIIEAFVSVLMKASGNDR